MMFLSIFTTDTYSKPDLEKAYKEGLNFAQNQVQENQSIFKPRVGVCQKTRTEDDILKCLKGGKGHELDIKMIDAKEKKEEEHLEQTEQMDKIYVFVSFSMPKESIEALLMSAEKHHAVLVLRGLKNNSFKETAKVLYDFYKNQKGEGTGFEINPELFQKHNITHVPVFLDVKNQNKLSGNVTLNYAVQKLKEEFVS